MNKTHTLIIIIVIFAGVSAALSMAYASNKAKQAATSASAVATSTNTLGTSATGEKTASATADAGKPKLYSNQNVSFSSPQLLVTNVNSDHQFILSSTVEGKSSFMEVYVGKTGDCYKDFCKAPTLSSEAHNGIRWEFLGNPEHCDGTECSQPSALYRTKKASKDIYLLFFEYGPALNKDAIFSTFAII